MIKALILWLLGATFEVRLVSLKTGKDIPGRCLYKGGWTKARRMYRNKHLKYGNMVRLQAVNVLGSRINDMKPMTSEEAQRTLNWVNNQRLDNLKTAQNKWDIGASNAQTSAFMHEHQDEPNVSGPDANDLADNSAPAPRRSNETHDEWVKRVSGTLREGLKPIIEAHECNSDGPLEWDSNAQDYVTLCSICDTPQ